MCKRTIQLLIALTLSLPALLLAEANGPWGYKLGEPASARQVNICDTRAEASRLAQVFENRGGRVGYAALSASPQCRIAVVAFTPQSLLRSVPVHENDVLMYTMNFIVVTTSDSDTRVVVTTRSID
jgi:hypothetical protein